MNFLFSCCFIGGLVSVWCCMISLMLASSCSTSRPYNWERMDRAEWFMDRSKVWGFAVLLYFCVLFPLCLLVEAVG